MRHRSSTEAERCLTRATILGYLCGIADHGTNPFHPYQSECWAWERGHEQGVRHRTMRSPKTALCGI